jgi:hydrogenase nickel incorporation protein HypA/HybF
MEEREESTTALPTLKYEPGSLRQRLHELSIAQTIVESVVSEAERRRAERVAQIDVDVGELMQLDTKVLAAAVRVLLDGSRLKGARVRLHVESAAFACRRCGRQWGMTEAKKQLAEVPGALRIREPDSREIPLHFIPYLYPAFLRCPGCGSSDIFAYRGKEIRLRSVTPG